MKKKKKKYTTEALSQTPEGASTHVLILDICETSIPSLDAVGQSCRKQTSHLDDKKEKEKNRMPVREHGGTTAPAPCN